MCVQFAARRARTYKDHEALWDEVFNTSDTKRHDFLERVVVQEWSLDVLEMAWFMWDIENVPSWLPVELYRQPVYFSGLES